MNNVKVRLNKKGVGKLLKSKELADGLNRLAFAAQSRLGDGYEAYVATTRAVAVVETATPQAVDDNSAHNTLLKATSTAHGIEGVHHHKRLKDCRAIRYRRKR